MEVVKNEVEKVVFPTREQQRDKIIYEALSDYKLKWDEQISKLSNIIIGEDVKNHMVGKVGAIEFLLEEYLARITGETK